MINRHGNVVLRTTMVDEPSKVMQGVSRQAGEMTTVFGDLNRAMTSMGLGAIGVGVALNVISNASSEVAQTTAPTEAAFEKLSPLFGQIGDDLGVTSPDFEKAFTASC